MRFSWMRYLHESMYFAHPINAYGTDVQRGWLASLRACGLARSVINPDTPIHDAAYKRWKERTGIGMAYFTQVIIPECEALAFLPFGDGMISSGVGMEIDRAIELELPVYECTLFDHGKRITPVRDGQQIPLRLRYLSRDATIARVRDAAGASIAYA